MSTHTHTHAHICTHMHKCILFLKCIQFLLNWGRHTWTSKRILNSVWESSGPILLSLLSCVVCLSDILLFISSCLSFLPPLSGSRTSLLSSLEGQVLLVWTQQPARRAHKAHTHTHTHTPCSSIWSTILLYLFLNVFLILKGSISRWELMSRQTFELLLWSLSM